MDIIPCLVSLPFHSAPPENIDEYLPLSDGWMVSIISERVSTMSKSGGVVVVFVKM